MDEDLQKLLRVWYGGDDHEADRIELLKRLENDDAFRAAFVSEVALISQIKAAQSSEPRWLQLEELISGSEPTLELSLEARVMNAIGDLQQDSVTQETSLIRRHVPLSAVGWGMVSVLLATVAFLLLVPQKDSVDPSSRSPIITDPVIAESETSRDGLDRSFIVSSRDIAFLGQAADAEWGSGLAPSVGDGLKLGTLQLKKGIVQLDFYSGARLIVSAPAELELKSPDSVILNSGVTTCFVSQLGQGFRVRTADLLVTDLGASFGVTTQPGQPTEVHVLEGNVEVRVKGTTSTLKQSNAIQVSRRSVEEVEFRPSLFPQASDVETLKSSVVAKQYSEWKKYSDSLSSDPATLLHFNFEGQAKNSMEVFNRSKETSSATDGLVIGAEWSEGRWPQKGALRYSRPNDRLLVDVPGEHTKMTFFIWTRIDALTQTHTSLLMTEDPFRRKRLNPARQNEPVRQKVSFSTIKGVRWEIYRPESRIGFSLSRKDLSVIPPVRWETHVAIPQSLDSIHRGQWTCLGLVYDAETLSLKQFYNGKVTNETRLQVNEPIVLNHVTIGNYSIDDEELTRTKGAAQRRLCGSIDEVLISNRAYSEQEMESIWQIGSPSQSTSPASKLENVTSL